MRNKKQTLRSWRAHSSAEFQLIALFFFSQSMYCVTWERCATTSKTDGTKGLNSIFSVLLKDLFGSISEVWSVSFEIVKTNSMDFFEMFCNVKFTPRIRLIIECLCDCNAAVCVWRMFEVHAHSASVHTSAQWEYLQLSLKIGKSVRFCLSFDGTFWSHCKRHFCQLISCVFIFHLKIFWLGNM